MKPVSYITLPHNNYQTSLVKDGFSDKTPWYNNKQNFSVNNGGFEVLPKPVRTGFKKELVE